MLKEHPSALERDDLPDVEVRRRRGISVVWLIPLVAGAIALWLGYTTLQEKGPTIRVVFDNAEGLEAGKTRVKYRNVEVGLVDQVTLSEDLSHVVLAASLDKSVAAHMREGTQFWIVRPRVGFGGISGLGTLLSGAYVEFDPGDGEPVLEFAACPSRHRSPHGCRGPSFFCAPTSSARSAAARPSTTAASPSVRCLATSSRVTSRA